MVGRTLFDRLTGANKPVAAEERYNNPFKARIGNAFHLDLLDYRGVFYTLKRLEILDRGTGVLMTDYYLEGKPFGESEKRTLVLRTVPRDGKVGKEKIDFRILALSLYFECGNDDRDTVNGIMQGVNDPAGEFVCNPGQPDEKKYWRLQGLKTSENVTVTTLKDDDANGIVEDHEIDVKRIEFWGYSRTTLDEAKQEINEYLYVQKDSKTGWLSIFIGTEIPPERINI